MQRIATVQAAEGMVLAKDVETAEGRVLCGKGTELTPQLIDRLKRMEISHVTVEGHPVPEPGARSLEEELLELDRRFSKVERVTPLMYLKKRLRQKLIAARKQ